MTFDVNKYPGYTEMIFRNRKPTLTRKKPIATMETGDGLKVAMYDFYNKFHFFMKFDGFAPMVNVYSDNDYSAVQRDGAIADYSEKFGKITIIDIERIFNDTITKKQPATVSAEFIDFCQQYAKRKGKGMDVSEEEKPVEEKKPQVVAECHVIKYDSDGKMVYEPQELESEDVTQEEQNENAPLNVSEISLAVEYEDNEAELKPQPMTPEDEAVFEQASKSKEVEPNFKKTKKSAKAKKKSSKKSKK